MLLLKRGLRVAKPQILSYLCTPVQSTLQRVVFHSQVTKSYEYFAPNLSGVFMYQAQPFETYIVD